MSFLAIRWVWTLDGLTSTQKIVLLAICDMCDGGGVAWPSQATLARQTSLTDRSVRAALKTLEVRGLISRVSRYRPDGRRTSDLVTVHCPGLSTTQPSKSNCAAGATRPRHPSEGGSTPERNGVPKTPKAQLSESECPNAIPTTALPEAVSSPERKDVPEPPGIIFQESNKYEPTSQNLILDFGFELCPEPDGSSDLHNSAVAVYEMLRDELDPHLDYTSPGIQNTAVFRGWVEKYEPAWIVKRIRFVLARKKPGLIHSWIFFSGAMNSRSVPEENRPCERPTEDE